MTDEEKLAAWAFNVGLECDGSRAKKLEIAIGGSILDLRDLREILAPLPSPSILHVGEMETTPTLMLCRLNDRIAALTAELDALRDPTRDARLRREAREAMREDAAMERADAVAWLRGRVVLMKRLTPATGFLASTKDAITQGMMKTITLYADCIERGDHRALATDAQGEAK